MNLLKESWNRKTISEVHWQMYCTSVFLLYNQMVSPQSPFQYWVCGWLDISKAEAQPDKVYKINPSSSCVLFEGDKMGGKKKRTKKFPQKKKKYCSSWNPFFSAGFCESHLKEKKKIISFFSFFFFSSSSLKTEQAVDYTLHQLFFAVSCEVVVCRLVLEMMKVHLHWRDNQAGHGWKKKQRQKRKKGISLLG